MTAEEDDVEHAQDRRARRTDHALERRAPQHRRRERRDDEDDRQHEQQLRRDRRRAVVKEDQERDGEERPQLAHRLHLPTRREYPELVQPRHHRRRRDEDEEEPQLLEPDRGDDDGQRDERGQDAFHSEIIGNSELDLAEPNLRQGIMNSLLLRH